MPLLCFYVRVTEVVRHHYCSNLQLRGSEDQHHLDVVIENINLVHPFLVFHHRQHDFNSIW